MNISSVSLIFLAALVGQAAAFNLRDIASSVSITEEHEEIESTNGKTDYEKTFLTMGKVESLCFNYSEFCDTKVYGDLAWLYCFAAQKASAQAKAAWAIRSRLQVKTNDAGRVNAIDLTTSALTSTMAVTFSEVAVGTGIESNAQVKVEGESESSNGDTLKAASLALGSVSSGSSAYAKAKSLGEAKSETITVNGQDVTVRGQQLTKFVGSVYTVVSSFSESSSETQGATISKIAAGAFEKTLAKTTEFWIHDFTAGQYNRAVQDAVVDSFGKAYAASMARVGIAYTIDAFLVAEGNTIRISLKANTSAFSGKICGPAPTKGK